MNGHRYTNEQIAFLTANVIGRSREELTNLFNTHFQLQLKHSQIDRACCNRKLRSGRDTRFKAGQIPFNKGKKGVGGWEPTQFKKGQMPHNYKPVGTERINRDGYVEIKIADPKTWRAKHVVIWEAANGAVPKGHAVIFGDGNRRNFELDNLLLVSRRQLAVMNHKKLIKNNAELTKAGIVVADVYMKMTECNRRITEKHGSLTTVSQKGE